MAKVSLHITVDEDLLKAAKRKREKTGRSIAHVVSEALREWVKNNPPAEPKEEQPEHK